MNAAPVRMPTNESHPAGALDLEVVSGRSGDGEPLSQGLRLLRELLDAGDAVLFSILPRGLVFHAAVGEGSARLGQHVTAAAEVLRAQVQGACILGAGAIAGNVGRVSALEVSPVEGALVLAERRNRDVAFAVAVSLRRSPNLPSTVVLRFAHAIFRDLARLVHRHERGAPQTGLLDQDWEKHRYAGLVGRSRQMHRLFGTVGKLASSDVNVLVLGESGTGKELVARAIHDGDLYAGRKFVAQNCAALPEALLESELFGHCKGAFTGALFDKKGLFEEAHGGTFFLDEIADMPMALQIKMLRVLQDGEIRRLGETRTHRVAVRIIAATNKNLRREVERGRFREDLYYRLNVVKLELPPLRRRREDVPLLLRYFADQVCVRLQRPSLHFTEEAMQRLLEHDWPGNVRELENEIERLVALYGDEGVVQPFMLSERVRYGSGADWSLDRLEEIRDLHQASEYLERALIGRSLERHAWNKSRAAAELGVSRQGLIKKVKRLRLQRPDAAGRASGRRRVRAIQNELPFVAAAAESTPGAVPAG